MLPRRASLLLLLFSLQAGAAAIEPPPERGKWFAVRADNVHVFSNTSAAATRELGGDLLQMRHAIGEITKLDVRTPYTTRVFLYADEKSLAPYLEAVMGQGVAGFRSGYDNLIELRTDAQGAVGRAIYHNVAHYVVENAHSSPPLWAREGLAEYCSTLASKDGAIDRPISGHVETLRQKPLLPLRELFAVKPGAPLYDEGRRAGIYHAQSWALVHYLAGAGEERRAQFARFLQRTNAGEPADGAFEASFGAHADLEKELRQHVRKLTAKSTKSAPGEAKVAEAPEAEPMMRDAVLYELGRVVASMREDHAVHAVKFFENALELNPSHSGALASLGVLHQRAARMQEAEAAFARAIELGSDDHDIYLLLGRAILDRYANVQQPPQAEILKARSMFTKAAELRPESALAWVGVGTTYFADDDVAPGIAAVQRARTLDPREPSAPRVLRQLQERQQMAVIHAASASARAGKLIDALSKLDQLIPTITNQGILQVAWKLRAEVARVAARH
jgi:tetratricopeptide (TPR) repeat protein